jgi:hypothetical protein
VRELDRSHVNTMAAPTSRSVVSYSMLQERKKKGLHLSYRMAMSDYLPRARSVIQRLWVEAYLVSPHQRWRLGVGSVKLVQVSTVRWCVMIVQTGCFE